MKKNIFKWLSIFVMAALCVGFASCGDDDDELDFEKPNDTEKPINTSSVVLFVDDTKVIEGDISISKSENSFIASVEHNIITANHVGQTSIVVNEKYKIPVTVTPQYLIMTSDPILDWGITKDEVKSRWKLGTLDEKDNILGYHDCGDATLVGYSFENGKLNGVTIAVPMSKGIKFTKYLTERFFIDPREIEEQYVGFDAYTLKDAKTSILYDVSGKYKIGSTKVYVCTYMPANR